MDTSSDDDNNRDDGYGPALDLVKWIFKNYIKPLYIGIKNNPVLLENFPGFLLSPDVIVVYWGRTHVGVEYIGPDRLNKLPDFINPRIEVQDYSLSSRGLLEEIIGFEYDGNLSIPLPPFSTNLVFPTNSGADELDRLKWDWSAQDMMLAFNSGPLVAPDGQFTRITNSRFFDADPVAGLKTRHIKWLDLLPCIYDDTAVDVDNWRVLLEPYLKCAQLDLSASYPVPTDFRVARLQKLNRLIEEVGRNSNSETEITRFLARDEMKFVLQMRFSATTIIPEGTCEWQSEERPAIRPDFFIIRPDGYAEIVEFKLPRLQGSLVVGARNRETFSSSINSYISQIRVYREYFEDPRNREFFKRKFGFEIYKPKAHLVMGRRWEFNNNAWRSIIADHPEIQIHTYDDLIDGVMAQFY